jgi:hypothetical protein
LLAIQKPHGGWDVQDIGGVMAYWSLRKDSLEDQSKEMIAFLAGLVEKEPA